MVLNEGSMSDAEQGMHLSAAVQHNPWVGEPWLMLAQLQFRHERCALTLPSHLSCLDVLYEKFPTFLLSPVSILSCPGLRSWKEAVESADKALSCFYSLASRCKLGVGGCVLDCRV